MHALRPLQRRRRLADTPPPCDRSKATWPSGAEATCSSQILTTITYDVNYTATTLMRMCTSDACMAIARAMRAANPRECLAGATKTMPLHAEFLDKLDEACRALDMRPITDGDGTGPTPTTASPTPPTPKPMPSTTPKPKTSTTSPVATQPTAFTNTPSSTTLETAGSSSGSSSSPASSKAPPSAMPSAVPLDGTHWNASTDSPSSPSGMPVSSITSTPTSPESTRSGATAPKTSPTDTTQQTTSGSSSSSTGTILSVVAGVLVVIIAALVIVIVRRRRRKTNSKDTSTMALSPHDADNSAFATPSSTYYTGDQASTIDHSMLASFESSHRNRELGRADLGAMLDSLVTWQIDSTELTDVELLGTGGQGAVFLVKLNDSRLLVSKRAVPDQLTEQKLQAMVEEIRLVATLQHPNIVAFVGVAWLTPYDLQALFEYMPNGDLRRHLEETKSEAGEPWTKRKLEMARSVAEGLAYVHSFNPPIVHRDLKTRNILLGEAFTAKIGDFGVSRLQSDDGTMTTGIGTSRWLAPEVIRGGGLYTEQCDIYSFGVVLVEMDTHALPFASLEGSVSEIMLLHQVARGERRPPVTQTCDPRIAALVDKCLHQDPSQRPNALEVAYELRQIIKSA